MSDTKVIRVGIMGLGTVGFGTATILAQNNDIILGRAGYKLEIAAVLILDVEDAHKKLESIGCTETAVETDPEAFFNNYNLDIAVELIGGTTVAKDRILSALNHKISVVTANKDLLAIYGKEVMEAAAANGVDIRFEAAVAGGIPIINVLKSDLIGNNIKSVMGIMNGTTNYILTKMYEDGANFEDVLKDAQDKGYAEADPTGDVGGLDAARKVAILSSIAFNSRVTLDDVYVEGITDITAEDISAAKKLGYVIKLLGVAKEEDGLIEARVNPVMIPLSHPLATVNDAFNAVFVTGDMVGETMFYGSGAGSLPTGSAVVGDICGVAKAIVEDNLGNFGCTCYLNKGFRKQDDYMSRFYIRMRVKDTPGVMAQIAACFGDNGVSLASVMQTEEHNAENTTTIMIVTHNVRQGAVEAAKRALADLDTVYAIDSSIRVE